MEREGRDASVRGKKGGLGGRRTVQRGWDSWKKGWLREREREKGFVHERRRDVAEEKREESFLEERVSERGKKREKEMRRSAAKKGRKTLFERKEMK